MDTHNESSQKILVLASGNAGKAREFASLLAPLGYNVKLQKEFGIESPEEDGLSFVENALLKARYAAKMTGYPAIADDSGICVDALNGAPGIYSARFAGVHGDDKSNNEKLLELLRDVKEDKRGAFYYCALVLVRDKDDAVPVIATGAWYGSIGYKEVGAGGFGYDPLFIVKGRNCTAAQLPEQIKNLISHRARAMMKLKALLHKDEI